MVFNDFSFKKSQVTGSQTGSVVSVWGANLTNAIFTSHCLQKNHARDVKNLLSHWDGYTVLTAKWVIPHNSLFIDSNKVPSDCLHENCTTGSKAIYNDWI